MSKKISKGQCETIAHLVVLGDEIDRLRAKLEDQAKEFKEKDAEIFFQGRALLKRHFPLSEEFEDAIEEETGHKFMKCEFVPDARFGEREEWHFGLKEEECSK